MIKMRIKLDEEKIIREKKYSLNEIKNTLDKIFANAGGFLDDNGEYTNGTFESFGAILAVLKNSDWFMDNVIEWLWKDSDFSEESTDFEVEDLLLKVGIRR